MNNTITHKKTSFTPWLMWILGATFYFYECLLQVSTGVMVPELMRSFNANATQIGILAAFWFDAYFIMQIPVGILVDRYGPRKLLTFASFTCMAGCLIFATAHIFGLAKFGRLLIGIGSAFAVISTMKIAAIWFKADRFSLLTGMLVTLGMLGSMTGQKPLALLVDAYDWRVCMLVMGAIGGVLAVLIWFIIRDNSSSSHKQQTKTPISKQRFGSELIKVISIPQNWIVAAYGGLMFAPTLAFGGLWGVPFLIQSHNLPRPEAASIITTLYIGWVFGSTATGWLSDKLQRRKPTMIIGSIGALLTILTILYVQSLSATALAILLFIFGVFSSGFLPAFSIIRESNPENCSATALGFMNTINTTGGVVFPPLIGILLDYFWQGQMLNGAREYTTTNYHMALLALPVAIFISLVILPLIRETYCRNLENEKA